MPTLTIDGQSVTVPDGTTILRAAQQAGIWIPYFCWHPKLEPMGACRVCFVEVEGQPKLSISCADPVREGMVVHTDSPAVVKARAGVIEFILANHPLDCPVCDAAGECDLQDVAFQYRCGWSRYDEPKATYPDEWLCDYIVLNRNRCFRCFRCVRYYDEIVGTGELSAKFRGLWTQIATFDHEPLSFGLCGNLTEVCPLGALTDGKYRFQGRPWEVRDFPSVCPGCALGCNVRVRTRFHRAVQIRPRENDGVNELWLCDRGRFGDPDAPQCPRLLSSLVRNGEGAFASEEWSPALDHVAGILRRAAHEHDPGSVGFIGSARLSNEDIFAFLHLAREGVRTPNTDHCTPPGALALQEILGAPRGTAAITDVGEGDVLLIGSDLAAEQPLLGIRARKGVRAGHSRLFVVDDAEHPLHIPVHRSLFGSSVASTVSALLDAALATASFELPGWLQRAESALPQAHVLPEHREMIAELRGERPTTILVGREVLEAPDGREVTAAILALAWLLDRDGQRVKILPLWRDANQQGALDLGLRPGEGGLDRDQMLDAALSGDIKVLYVVETACIESDPRWDEIAGKLDALIVQGAEETELSRRATIVLPTRLTWEREGTYTNLDGRVQRFHAALAPSGGGRPDWWVFAGLAHRLGAPLVADSAAAVFSLLAGQAEAYRGLSYDALGEHGIRPAGGDADVV